MSNVLPRGTKMGESRTDRPNRLNGADATLPSSECQRTKLSQACPKQVVIVDDDHDILDEISEFLTSCGLVIHPHASPNDAISFMKAHDFDVLLSDIEMPGMRGTQLAAWLNDWRPEVPVILISGLNIKPAELRDGWSFFRKPIDFAIIQKAIENSEYQSCDPTGPTWHAPTAANATPKRS